MRTWYIESAFMAAVLSGIILVTEPSSWHAWVGGLAVWITSRHMSVADRLREKESAGDSRPVECVRWLERYWVSKELLWLVYFVALGAWPALGGVALFALYPYWRRIYRAWRPRGRPHR